MYLRHGDRTRAVLMDHVAHLALLARALSRARGVRILVSCAVVGLAALTLYWRFSPQSAVPCATDFYSDYQSSVLVSHGVAPYGLLADWIHAYGPGQPLDPFSGASCLSGRLEFAYTPFFAFILTPFTWLPYHAALVVWDGANLLMLVGAIFAFLHAARLTPSLLQLVLLTCAAVFVSPLRFELYYAQADIFMLFFICLALWARLSERPTLAGLLLAVACASEPALLIGILFLVWKRELRFAAVALISSLVLIFTPFLWLGGTALRNLLLIWQFYANTYVVTFTNDAPKGVLARLLTSNVYVAPLANAPQLVTPLWLLVVVLVLLVASLLISRRPLSNDGQSLLEVGLAVAALLLVSPWSENNHFTLLIVSFLAVYVYLWQLGRLSSTTRLVSAGFIGALLLFIVLGDPIQYALVARMQAHPATSQVYVPLAATYLYSLLAIAVVIIYARRLNQPPITPASAADEPAFGGYVMPPSPRADIARSTPIPSITDSGDGPMAFSQMPVSASSLTRDNVRRIHIIGGPGAGKTTLSCQIAALLDVPVFELDEVAEAGPAPDFRMQRPLAQRLAEVERIVALPGWITEGSFLWWTDALLRAADVIIWLDPPRRVALTRLLARQRREHLRELRGQTTPRAILQTLRHSHLRHRVSFVRYTWRYYSRPLRDVPRQSRDLDDGWALTRAATASWLEEFAPKVICCERPAQAAQVVACLAACKPAGGDSATIVHGEVSTR